ncbi:hypothetical protein H2202_000362 [Exophiala xenobiotica]|nr:hypothetical protein H2202_000362 [Exophiala xenobiotica]KAK5244895.1 hypothetical protein LTS06_009572 [Exophiala xenobiotica]KAK5356642.1 hypothetical protein LTR61_000377 [Exophiala xenobiotica]KAK5376794.1 hypothetical protein LTR11_004458 [Exophiala xenobiotica]KAK5406605.1 hypothetical protein LTR06_008099 [Exophiala xenobiotica]
MEPFDYPPRGGSSQGPSAGGPRLPPRPSTTTRMPYQQQQQGQMSAGIPSHTRRQHAPGQAEVRVPPQRPVKPRTLGQKPIAHDPQPQADGGDLAFSKNDIIIAVMGVTGAGKSTFISLLSDQEIKIGHGLQSCTSTVGVYHFMLHGVRVWLIDTPGFDDTNRSDAEVLKDVAFWLAAAYTKETRLAGIIYLHRIIDVRMSGAANRNLRMFRQLCGVNNLNSVILATTHWTDENGNTVPEAVGQARINELQQTEDFWGGMIAKGSRVEKHDGSAKSARRIVSNLVDRRIQAVLDIQRQLVDEHRSLDDTDAGQALQSEPLEERKKSEARLAELKLDMEDALQEKDLRWQEEIRKSRAKFEADIAKGVAETAELKTNIQKMTEEKEAQLRAMQAQMEEDRKQFQAKLDASREAIEAVKSEQRHKEAEYQKQRALDAQRAKERAEEHRREMAAEQQRLMAESDKVARERIEQETLRLEQQFTRERDAAMEAARERDRDWTRKQEAYEREEARLRQERAEVQREMLEQAKENAKRKHFSFDAIGPVVGVIKLGLAVAGIAHVF